MKIHDFVIDVCIGDKVALYNTLNGAIVSIGQNNLKLRDIVDLESKDYTVLNDYLFFEDSSKILDKVRISRSKDRRLLDITVSFTQTCNLACSYCSQWDSRDHTGISEQVLDDLIEYISNCVVKENYQRVGINLFGGEPLLEKQKILYLKNNLEKVIDPQIISYGIGTNGVLLDEEFLSKFDQLSICITLSLQPDHDKNRPFTDKSGSFNRIVENLKNCRDFFDDKIRLKIRYNVGENYADFEEFLVFLRDLDLDVSSFEMAFTEEFNYTSYKNSLSKESYGNWYLSKGIDLLIKYGYSVWFPLPSLYTCKAYNPHSLKVFPNGTISACNGHKYIDRKDNIANIKDDVSLTSEILSEIKNSNVISPDCEVCKYLLICGGKYLCRKDNCYAFMEYPIEDFLTKYIELTREGKADCFDI